MCSFSELRMAPFMMATSRAPSARASMSLYLPSVAIGHSRMSAALSISRMKASVSRIETSQPPQAAPQ